MSRNEKLIENMKNWEKNQNKYDIIKYYSGMYELATTKNNRGVLTELINTLKQTKNGKRN